MNVFVVLSNGQPDAVFLIRTHAERHTTAILDRTPGLRVEIRSAPFYDIPDADGPKHERDGVFRKGG